MDRTRAAEGYQRVFARIASALGRYCAQHARHRRIRHLRNSVCDAFDVELERPGKLALDRRLRCFAIDLELRAGDRLGIHVTQQHVGIRDGRLGAAAPIAYRTRFGAGAARAYAQRATVVDPRDTAAACSRLHDVYRGHAHNVSAATEEPGADGRAGAYLPARLFERLPVLDEACLDRRPAHVER